MFRIWFRKRVQLRGDSELKNLSVLKISYVTMKRVAYQPRGMRVEAQQFTCYLFEQNIVRTNVSFRAPLSNLETSGNLIMLGSSFVGFIESSLEPLNFEQCSFIRSAADLSWYFCLYCLAITSFAPKQSNRSFYIYSRCSQERIRCFAIFKDEFDFYVHFYDVDNKIMKIKKKNNNK